MAKDQLHRLLSAVVIRGHNLCATRLTDCHKASESFVSYEGNR